MLTLGSVDALLLSSFEGDSLVSSVVVGVTGGDEGLTGGSTGCPVGDVAWESGCVDVGVTLDGADDVVVALSVGAGDLPCVDPQPSDAMGPSKNRTVAPLRRPALTGS